MVRRLQEGKITMPIALNATHDPHRRSWVESANQAGTDFPLQNLPLGLYRADDGSARPCTAIGDQILDIWAAHDHGLMLGPSAQAAEIACTGGSLNALIAEGQPAASALRAGLSYLLGTDGEAPRWGQAAAGHLLLPQITVTLLMPVAIGGFTDFLCSLPHSERMGRMLRPDNPLPPSFKYLPIAYNGRASSIMVSGTDLTRPHVQRGLPDGTAAYGPCTALDYELELGAVLVGGNPLGTPLSMEQAAQQVFGYTLLNDWSARDIQRWESAPLGPFLGKSLLTTISPWIVTEEAMAPFRSPSPTRAPGDPQPFAYLDSAENQESGALDITLEAWLLTDSARGAGQAPHRLTRTQFRDMYWTPAQMVAHHASNGCNLRPGDLIGSGTASDATAGGRACLAEMQPDGPITLPNGAQRRFLEDGDEIILRAQASRDGFVSIGFGDCRGVIRPARA
jgi:fumarylacetoacetase